MGIRGRRIVAAALGLGVPLTGFGLWLVTRPAEAQRALTVGIATSVAPGRATSPRSAAPAARQIRSGNQGRPVQLRIVASTLPTNPPSRPVPAPTVSGPPTSAAGVSRAAAVAPSTALPTTVLPSTVVPSTVLPSTVLPSTVLPSTVLPSTVLPVPSTTIRPKLAAWRLADERSFAEGAWVFRPLDAKRQPRRSRAEVLRTARRSAAPGRSGPDPTILFAEFEAPVGEWLGEAPNQSGGIDVRPVWVVVFLGVVGQRSTGVVERKRGPQGPTTTSRRVVTDVLVVVDDATGEVVVRSEYAAQAP